MKYFHERKRKNYFEGWFFKHDSKHLSIAFIPSISKEGNGIKKCFIQVITNIMSHKFTFNYEDFKASKDELGIVIKNNLFSNDGIKLDLKDDKYHIVAQLKYGLFEKIKSDIMGFFRYFPFMECKHQIISMRHSVNGMVKINGEEFIFNDDLGYLEMDYGTSFPTNYLWLQCNHFNNDSSFFLSYATIPYIKVNFKGFICSLIVNGIEYRFATYNGSKVIVKEPNHIVIKKRKLLLDVIFQPKQGNSLLAPELGAMSRSIIECLDGTCNLRLQKKNKILFESFGYYTGIEENTKKVR